MLVLSRKEGESFVIGNDIKITIIRPGSGKGSNVRIGIEAPKNVLVVRSELLAVPPVAVPSLLQTQPQTQPQPQTGEK